MKSRKPASALPKSAKVLATFKYPMEVEIRESEFKPLASITLLDLSRLSKGTHKIEVGFATGGCCQKAVFAIIKKGMVTDIEFEMCEESDTPVTKELLTLIQTARRKMGMRTPAKWVAIPVTEFFESPAQMSRIIISARNWCIQICITIGTTMTCYFCCAWPPRCGSDTIYTGPL